MELINRLRPLSVAHVPNSKPHSQSYDTPYRYRPLAADAQTRIIELQPSGGDADAPLRCNICDIDVESLSSTSYEAVSYTWEDQLPANRLIVDDAFMLLITPNLRDGLVRLRDPHVVRTLWVDAVCIDQNDAEDKARQIPFMYRIYRMASRVVVWLGEHKFAESTLRILDRFARYELDISVEFPQVITSQLIELAALPWFERLWVVQEVCANADVILKCGSVAVPFVRIATLFYQQWREESELWFRTTTSHTALLMAALWLDTHGFSKRKILKSVLELFVVLKDKKCKDDRDRIYAIAGMGNDAYLFSKDAAHQNPIPSKRQALEKLETGSSMIPLIVDYSATVEEVYLGFAKACAKCLQNSQSPEKEPLASQMALLLMSASNELRNESRNQLPSWVPDWRMAVGRHALWDEDAYPSAKISVDETANTLGLRFDSEVGVIKLGVIESLSRPFQTEPRDLQGCIAWLKDAMEMIYAWVRDSNSSEIYRRTGLDYDETKEYDPSQVTERDLEELLRDQLLYLLTRGPHDEERWSEGYDWPSLFRNWLLGSEDQGVPDISMTEDNDADLLGKAIIARTYGYSLFITTPVNGRPKSFPRFPIIGLAPQHAQLGDGVYTADTNYRYTDIRSDWMEQYPYEWSFLLRNDEAAASEPSVYVGDCLWMYRFHLLPGLKYEETPMEGSVRGDKLTRITLK
ncbi:Heterokaryon incompatibility protein [Paramyrothecium foliicola]|nr:Heterokaryon incompatibility protein [Paramyrothecium foliicola]